MFRLGDLKIAVAKEYMPCLICIGTFSLYQTVYYTVQYEFLFLFLVLYCTVDTLLLTAAEVLYLQYTSNTFLQEVRGKVIPVRYL